MKSEKLSRRDFLGRAAALATSWVVSDSSFALCEGLEAIKIEDRPKERARLLPEIGVQVGATRFRGSHTEEYQTAFTHSQILATVQQFAEEQGVPVDQLSKVLVRQQYMMPSSFHDEQRDEPYYNAVQEFVAREFDEHSLQVFGFDWVAVQPEGDYVTDFENKGFLGGRITVREQVVITTPQPHVQKTLERVVDQSDGGAHVNYGIVGECVNPDIILLATRYPAITVVSELCHHAAAELKEAYAVRIGPDNETFLNEAFCEVMAEDMLPQIYHQVIEGSDLYVPGYGPAREVDLEKMLSDQQKLMKEIMEQRVYSRIPKVREMLYGSNRETIKRRFFDLDISFAWEVVRE